MKKFFTAVILPATLAMLFISCQQSFDTAKDVNAQPRNTVEQKRVNHITYGVDYENPITGEYLRWGQSNLPDQDIIVALFLLI